MLHERIKQSTEPPKFSFTVKEWIQPQSKKYIGRLGEIKNI